MHHNKEHCDSCSITNDEQIVFVQYYDMISEKAVPKDTVDEKLNCTRLKWDCHGDSKELQEQEKVFGLFPVDIICDRVLVIRSNALL